MNVITADTLLDLIPSILFYFAVGTLGAFTKNTYETMTKQVRKIRLGEVLIGGIVTTIICIGLSDTVFKNFSLNLMAFVTFVLGGLGFEIFGNMTSIDKIRNLLAIVNEVRKGINSEESGARSTREFETPPPPTRVLDSQNEDIIEVEGPENTNESPEIEIRRDADGNIRVIVPSQNELKIEYTAPGNEDERGG